MNTIDRTPDGIEHKCCECSRDFKGDAWHDYCAECNAANEKYPRVSRRDRNKELVALIRHN